MDLAEPPVKTFIQENKDEILSLQKRGQSHLAATCKHSPYTRKKNRSYAQKTVEIQIILFFHYFILFNITDSCLVLLRRQKRQQPHTEQPQCELLNGAAPTGATAPRVCSELHSCLLGQGAVWDAISSLHLIYLHAGIPKSSFTFQKWGVRII